MGEKRLKMGSLASDGDGSDNCPAKRTRANLSLVGVDLEFIEKMMPLPDEDPMAEFQFFDDDDEVGQCLRSMHNIYTVCTVSTQSAQCPS